MMKVRMSLFSARARESCAQLGRRFVDKSGMRLCCVVLALVTLIAPGAASAQDRWVFVQALVVSEQAPNLAAMLESAVGDRRVLSTTAASTLVEARHSSPAPKLDEQEISRAQALVTRVTNAIRMGEAKRAWLKQLRELKQLAAPVQDYLQRDARRAELLFQACVLAGGLLIKAKQNNEAHEQLRSCARIYPGRKPQAAPEVVSAFAAAAAEVAAEPHGSLDVEGGNCSVRINGAELGTAPLHVDAVRVGTARIQMECDGTPGRVHGVGIEPGANRVHIDPDFERSLSTGSGLALTYADAEVRERLMIRHGQLLGDLLDAHVVLLVPTDGRTRVLSLQPRAELGTLSGERIPADVVRAVVAAMGKAAPPPPKPTPPPTPEVTADESKSEESPAPARPNVDLYARVPTLRDEGGTTVAEVVVGGTLIAAGLGSWITSWVFYGQRAGERASTDWSLSYEARDNYRSDGRTALWFAAGGGVLLSVAEYLLLPRERGVPTSAWAWGGAGVLLAASGLTLMIAEAGCTLPSQQCRGFASDVALGQLLMLHSIPLLSVPLNYALRDWFRPTRRIELGLNGTHLSLSYRF